MSEAGVGWIKNEGIHLCKAVGSLWEEKLVSWLCGTVLPDGHMKSLLG